MARHTERIFDVQTQTGRHAFVSIYCYFFINFFRLFRNAKGAYRGEVKNFAGGRVGVAVPLEFFGDLVIPGETLGAFPRPEHLEQRKLLSGTFTIMFFVLTLLLEVGKADVKILVALVADDNFKVYQSSGGRVDEELVRRLGSGGIAPRNSRIRILLGRFERHRKAEGTIPFEGGKIL